MADLDNDVNTQLALVIQKLDALAITTSQNHSETRAMLQDHEQRLRALEKSNTEISAKMTMANIVQSTFTAIASTVAAMVGRTQ